MENPETSPKPASTAPVPSGAASKIRWAAHLVILTSYPLAIGGLSYFLPRENLEPTMLPRDPGALLTMISIQFALFLLIFGVACWVSRPTVDQLMLRWRGGWHVLWRGPVYSVGLRLGLAVLMLAAVFFAMAVLDWDQKSLLKMRPDVENLVDPETLANDPLYLWLNVTVVSFIFAGFREELWRAGMFAAITGLFPQALLAVRGKVMMVLAVAVVFGLGHLPMGWGGVALTTVLGTGLGLIMVFHRSIWDAVLAHGFFDATSFILICLLREFLKTTNVAA